jgi:Leucine-rich repeat (LRR) protein
MKQKLLLLLFLVSLSTYAQYTLIPDVKFENALIAQGIDTDGLNGKVLTSSINTVIDLDISMSDISDLTGIQNFIALSSLECSLNLLTSLDLSKNSKLSIIDCRGNNLTSLDLSNLPLLTGVFCSENFLTSLDVSKNPILTGVFCSKNNLISLNVKNGNNTNFQALFFDFRYNPLLSCIQVDDVAYSNANWVDTIDNTAVYSNSCGPSYTTIPDSNFEKKLISLGIDTDGKNDKVLTSSIISLTTLDVSNSLITDLTGIENFLNLEILNVSGNQLTLLNTASLKKIKTLDCSNNLLNFLDLTENPSLVTLNFSNNQLSSVDLWNNPLIVTLKGATNTLATLDINGLAELKILEIDSNQLVNLDVSQNMLLSTIKCNNNLLATLDVSQNTALNSLHCGNNQLVKLDITANLLLREITCENNLLTQLNLKNDKNSLFTIFDFRNNPNLQCIEVDSESYSNLYWSAKKDATTNYNLYCGPFTLIPDPKFEDKLIALGIDIDGKNGKTLTTSITNLSALDLSNSIISDLSGIQDFTNLKTLNVFGNQLTILDLSKNILVEVLNCSNNQIASLDFTKHLKLTDLYCNNNNLIVLNLKNGKNSLLINFDFRNNPNLSCIQVDNESYSNLNWSSKKDATSSFSLFCGAFTLIPDSNFEKKLVTLGIDIDGYNGKVLTSSIIEVTTLNLNNGGISNLTGIQDFKKLTNLDCSNNPLTVLDITKNNLLKTLDCHSSTLTNLDVTQATSLTTLNCENNSIKTLDLTKSIALTSLSCSNNQLSDITLTNNPLLNYLDCSKNMITTLNVINNSELQTLNCSNNLLTSIDVTHNVALKIFLPFQNQITVLNVASNPLLYELRCNNNLLASIDISINTALSYISCYSNKLTYANLKNGNNSKFPNMFIQDNPDLYCIQVDNKADANLRFGSGKDPQATFSENCSEYTLIPDANFEDKLIALGIDVDGKNGKVKTSQIVDITELNLSGLSISNLKGIEDFTKLTILNCASNSLTQLDLSKNLLLDQINCSNNQIIDLDFSKNTALHALNCAYNNLSTLNLENGNIKRFVPFNSGSNDFSHNPNLTCIRVDDINYAYKNWIGLKDPTASYSRSCGNYADILDSNLEKKLISLGFDKDGLNGKILKSDAVAVVNLDVSGSYVYDLSVLEFFTSLKNLNCSGNNIPELNLYHNPLLTSLDCSNTKITSLDLSKNQNLTRLNCNSSQLTRFSIKNGNNTAITSIDLKNNPGLICIEVDDPNYSTSQWSLKKDAGASFSASCEAYTAIPDDNFEYKLIALGIDKDGKNGKVVTNNISKITQINISSSKISDLTGIQDFKALTTLTCDGNILKSIDLSTNTPLTYISFRANLLEKLDLSKNTNLIILDCTGNQITDLDLTYNQQLTNVSCSSNQLAKLNIIQCNKLKYLYCHINKLTLLDIPKTASLLSIYCDRNQLASLDVSNLSSVGTVNCANNYLTTLNASNNPLLQDLSCYNNKLTSLNVSNNPLLATLSCSSNKLVNLNISQNPSLKELSFSENELTSIDFSKNIKLERFYCQNNKLNSILDFSKTELLSVLNCSNNQLKSINLKMYSKTQRRYFYGFFTNNPDLTCIGVDNESYAINYWNVTKDITVSYSVNCPPLFVLISSEFEDKLMALGIDTDGKNGSVLLSNITNVKSIDVSNSGITNLSGIEYFKALETLICKGNSLTTINLSSNTALKYLDCSNNPLTTLDVSKNILLAELYCDGVVTIINKMSNAKTSSTTQLTVLDLSNNLFLTKLSCSNNQIISLDVSKNNLLQDINCSNNSMQNLNVNNGNNTNMLNVNFKNNSLSCIKVDNDVYSNSYWAAAKDSTATYSKTACTLGIEDVVSDRISIYPNPVKGQLHIDNIVLEKVTVYDALGKLIKTTKFINASDSNTLDLVGLTKGIYFIYLQSEGTNIARKMIVE